MKRNIRKSWRCKILPAALMRAATTTAASIGVLAYLPSVQGAQYTWDNGFGNANWSNPTNWSGVPDNTEPTLTDSAYLPAGFPGGASTIAMQPGELVSAIIF